MLAAFGGTLTRTSRGCLTLDIGDGELMVTQFPYGSTLTDDGQSVTLPDQTVIRLGGTISGGGGVGDAGSLKRLPLECLSAAKVLHLQST